MIKYEKAKQRKGGLGLLGGEEGVVRGWLGDIVNKDCSVRFVMQIRVILLFQVGEKEMLL